MVPRGFWDRAERGRRLSAQSVNGPGDEVRRLSRFSPGTGLGLHSVGSGGLALRIAARFVTIGLTGSGGIPGRTVGSTTRLGRGEITECGISFEGDDDAESEVALTTAGPTLTAFNLAKTAVAGNAVVICLKIFGILIVVWEECEDADGS